MNVVEKIFKKGDEFEEQYNRAKKKPTMIKGKVKPIIGILQAIKLGIGFGIGLTISSIIIILTIILIFGNMISSIFSQIF